MISRCVFIAVLSYLTEDDGGLSTPISSGHWAALQFSSYAVRLFGTQNFVDVDLVFPGDKVTAEITLVVQNDGKVIYSGADFEIFDGDNVVGTGVVKKLIKQ